MIFRSTFSMTLFPLFLDSLSQRYHATAKDITVTTIAPSTVHVMAPADITFSRDGVDLLLLRLFDVLFEVLLTGSIVIISALSIGLRNVA